MLTRREFGRGVAMVAGASLLGLPVLGHADDDAMDEALARLDKTGPEYGGLSNHGPMAADALVAMGRSDAVVAWVDQYSRRLSPAPTATNRIAGDAWRGALGDWSRVGDLTAFFERELDANPWRNVLATWLPRLAPGIVAVAFHGVIRTGHAARSLSRRETPLRKRELAHGLAYWASRYRELPRRDGVPPAGAKPYQVLTTLDRVAHPERQGGSITQSMQAIAQLPRFPDYIDRVDTSGDASAFVSGLTGEFARVYLANADTRTIAFVHGVTGPSAARLLLPFTPAAARRDLLRHTWHAATALYCTLAQKKPKDLMHALADRKDWVGRAVASGDEHAIKMTEACLREYAIVQDTAYLLAASDVTGRLHA